MNAGQGRQPGQGAVCMRRAQIQPWKAGKQPATEPVAQDPNGGEEDQASDRAVLGKLAPEPERQAVKQCQTRYEQNSEQDGYGNRCVAVFADADVNPAGPAAEQAQASEPAGPEKFPGGQGYGDQENQQNRDGPQPPQVER